VWEIFPRRCSSTTKSTNHPVITITSKPKS
jgi:hypothetical protein